MDSSTESMPQEAVVESGRTYAIIDGNSLMHRAFHAIMPGSMNAPDGRPTNAIFGFVSMLLHLMDAFKPDGVVVAFDKGLPQVRIDMLPQYKAQRPPRDPMLSEQFPMIRELLEAMSIPTCSVEGWEGDDLLGTLGRQGAQQGHRMLLVTGDRDAYQLVTDRINVVATKKGVTDVVVYGPAEVEELYEGVRPDQIPDFYGLKGDTSDNIPGVPGIGPKKASALIVQYGSLDEVIAHAGDIKGKMGQNIAEHTADALVSREVARIRTDAPVVFDADEASWPDFDPDTVRVAFDAIGMKALKGRVMALATKQGATPVAGQGEPGIAALRAKVPLLPDVPVEGREAMEALREAVDRGEWVGVYVEPAPQDSLFSLDTVVYVALSSGWVVCRGADGEAPRLEATSATGSPIVAGYASDQKARILRFCDQEATQALALAYGSGKVSSFDVKSDLHLLYPIDSSEPAQIDAASVDPGAIFDVSVAAYLLDSNRSDYTPRAIASAYLPWSIPEYETAPAAEEPPARKGRGKEKPTIDPESMRRVSIATCSCTLALREQLGAMLEADGSAACMYDIEMPLVPVLCVLERTGMGIDKARLGELSVELAAQIEAIRDRVYEGAGCEFNIDSPAQLSGVLFDKLGLPKVDPETNRPLKKTKTGFYSTNAKMLEGFAATQPVVADVLDYREKVKIKSTYLDALPGQVDSDGRVHTTYNQTVTATGRLSSSDPNLQNIPVRSDLGRMVRTAFVPSPGSVILACDYSQIELRLLAHLSQDRGLIEAFTAGEDFHRETAARVFGIAPQDVTPEQRSKAKAVNFGIVYGQTAWGLSGTLKISAYEAQEMIDRYYATYPSVRCYLDEQVEFARKNGWVETMFGRKRRVPDIYSRVPNVKQFAERTAMNHPMQGSAADIIKLAMVRVQKRVEAEGLKAKMIVQVHDELDFDCPEDEVERLGAAVREEMQGVVELRVPLIVSCDTGTNWAEAK